MAQGFIPIEHYRTKFYQKEGQSKRFKEMTEEQLEAIAKKVSRKLEIMSENQSHSNLNSNRIERYQRILLYLTNPNIHFDIKTYDERLAFLILSTDPRLVTFKEFLKTNLLSIEEITKVEDAKERNRLLEERSLSLKDLESRVRDQIGFYDVKLLKHEEQFFKRFLLNKELITDVRQNNEDKFLLLSSLIQSFDSISDERYQELISIAESWLAQISTKPNSKVAVYSITNQKGLLGLNTLAEQFALFVLLVDPDLDMLRIYEEESMIPPVEDRIKDAFGFYNKAMLTLEKKYHERFCPDKKISIWSETK